MTHLEKLGFTIAAVAAMMAFGGATSASAAEFHTNTVGATLHGTQVGTHVLKIQGQSTTCKVAEFNGQTTTLTSPTKTLHPSYRECISFGFINSTVTTTGCDYVFSASGGTMDLNCEVGKQITITGGGCSIDLSPQTLVNGISYTNSADKKTLSIHRATTNLKWNVTSSNFPCPLSTGTGTNGTYTGTTSVTAGGATLWWE